MDRYQQSYSEALEANAENEEKWGKYKQELIETRENLKEYIKTRSRDIMVPMGRKAFVRGKIQHTNEITVCHGASMFSDVSSHQAIDILEHRMKLCDTQLEAIGREKELFANKLKLPEDAFSVPEEGREIIEEYDEAAENEWRQRHAASVRKQKQQEAEERRKQSAEVEVNKIFDDFELMEELANELESLEVEDDDTLAKVMSGELKVPEEKKRIAHRTEEVEEKPMEINNNDLIAQNNQEIVDLLRTYRCKIKEVLRNVKKDDERNLNLFLDLIELKEDIEDDIRKMNDEESDDSDDDETTESVEAPPEDKKRKVRFSTSLEDVKLIESKSDVYEEPEKNTIHIHFQHSSSKFTPETSEIGEISSPADIYKQFQVNPALPTAKKSILKNKTPEKLRETAKDEKPVKKVFHSELPVIGDVFEHEKEKIISKIQEEIIHVSTKGDPPKKVSKFKQMRLKS